MVKWMRVSGYLLVFVLIVVVLYWIRVVLVPFLLAAFLTYLLEPGVTHLERRGFHRVHAILCLYLAFSVFVVFVVLLLLPLILEELNRLADVIPEYALSLRDWLEHMQSDYSRLPVPTNVRKLLEQTVASAEERMLGAVSATIAGTFAFLGNVMRILITPVLAYYMLRDLPIGKRAIRDHMSRYKSWTKCLREIDQVVAGFVRGQVLVGLLVGGLTALALTVLGVRFAVLLGLLAFLGEFVPYFGPIISGLAAIGVALLASPLKAAQVALLFVIIQQFESGVIAPKVIGDRTGLHPLLVIFLVLTGGFFFGLWGLVLAVPVGAVLKVVVLHLFDTWSGRGRISPG